MLPTTFRARSIETIDTQFLTTTAGLQSLVWPQKA